MQPAQTGESGFLPRQRAEPDQATGRRLRLALSEKLARLAAGPGRASHPGRRTARNRSPTRAAQRRGFAFARMAREGLQPPGWCY